ncbi:MAG: class I SAM-dependent methyltransferase [Promethearchaeota archaeon]
MNNKRIIKEYAKQQYETHQNLNDRMNLWSYGTNPESLQKWIFNKIQLQEHERVLELGCGTGQLWLDNFRKVPSTCSIILSDFSKNMLDKAKKNLQPLNLPIKFEIIDAENIPFPNEVFDIVIGCHMLYHVPNIEKTLISISRILKPSGKFISTTVSQKHMQELTDFLSSFGLDKEEFDFFSKKLDYFTEFRNETGMEVLKPFFESIEFYEYINPVNITSIAPLMRYIESLFLKEHYPDFQKIKPEIEEAIKKIIDKKSKFLITGMTGLFEAKKP